MTEIKINTTNIRGLEIADSTPGEVAEWARQVICSAESCAKILFTPNAEIAQRCIEDRDVAELIRSADLLLPDGAGVILASRIIGRPLRSRITGVSFGREVLRIAAGSGSRVFFLGGKPGSDGGKSTAELAAERMSGIYPGLTVCGVHHGYFSKSGAENDAVIDKINAARAEILYVCFGVPAQEKWIIENRSRIPTVRLFMGLGGSIDIYSGTLTPTPALIQRLGLEWLHRLLRQPSRLPRMMKLPKYIFGSVFYRIRNGKTRRTG